MASVTSEMLRDRFRGCLVGLAVGDALGMPVETMTREEIIAATDGRGVTEYLAPLQKRFHSTTHLKSGQWTDDTQLSLAIARSLVRKRGFDLTDIAAEHVVEYRKERRGWGGSTTRGIRELTKKKRKPGEPVLDPEAYGLGNGVAMKIAPLVLCASQLKAYFLRRDVLEAVQALAELTHRDPCAATGAVLVGFAVQFMLTLAPRSFDAERQRSWTALMARVSTSINRCRPTHEREFVRRIAGLPSTADITAVAALTGTQCTVYESVPFVIGTVMHHGGNFRTGVLAAVNAGGDTDSNAAMVGAILGAAHGLSAIPREWVEGLEAHEEIIAIADQLFALATEKEKS